MLLSKRDLEQVLALLGARRTLEARQAQPQTILDQGSEPGRHRRFAGAGDHCGRNRRRSAGENP
jgi:hypothetical protein